MTPLWLSARPVPRYRSAPRVRRVAGLVCAAAVCAPLLVGCGDDGDETQSPSAAPSTSAAASSTSAPSSPSPSGTATGSLTEDQSERKALVPADKTGYRTAASTATGEVSGGTLTEMELKRDSGGKPVWATTVAEKDGTEHRVDVDAASGKVVRSGTEADQEADDKRSLADRLSGVKVSSEQAAEKATGRTKGTVTAIELDDTDDGTTIWSVDVVTTDDWNKTTYDVSAADGKILREHVDRD